MEKIRNIVFDMGNVLLRFDPEYFLDREGITAKKDRELLLSNIFLSEQWPMLDTGDMTEEELAELVIPRLPVSLHNAARRMIFAWEQPMEPIPGMADLVRGLKQKGYKLFLLSNASFRQPQYWPKIPGSEYFDGTVISAFQHCKKPDHRIYEILIKQYGLIPEECLFIDDVEENVAGARDAGMKAILFTGAADHLREQIFTQYS